MVVRNSPGRLPIIQIDAAINPGNSGGPTFDITNNVTLDGFSGWAVTKNVDSLFHDFSSPRQFWQLAVSTGFTVYCRGSRHVCMLFRGPSDCQLLRAPVAQTNSQVLGNAILHFGVYINRNTSIGNQLRLQFHWTHISPTPTKRWKRTKPNNLFHPQKIHFVDQISSCAVCTRWGLVLHLQGYPKHRMWDSWYVSNYFPDLNSVHDILTYDYSKDACSCPTGTQNLSFRLFVWTRFCHVLSTEAGVTNILTFPLCSQQSSASQASVEPLGLPTLISAMSNLSNLQVKYLNFPRLNCKCLSSGISVSIAPSRYSLGAFHVIKLHEICTYQVLLQSDSMVPPGYIIPTKAGRRGREPEPNFRGRPRADCHGLPEGVPEPGFLEWYLWNWFGNHTSWKRRLAGTGLMVIQCHTGACRWSQIWAPKPS